ncbi:MAG: lysophospholipid acyltransferase family protein [Zetaproteobacteria bacterium]|nr:lysophospholipid acyltransferase family protein [Zetaproteobacteria bacterium]
MGALLGNILFYFAKRHRNIALKNLQRIYPKKSAQERRKIATASFTELGRSIFELPHVFLRPKDFLLSRIQVEGGESFRLAMQEGKGVFIAGCHLGNWEIAGLIISMLGYPIHMIYRPIKQRSIETYLRTLRERFGSTMHSRLDDGIRWLPQVLKQGEAVLVVVDQHMSQGVQVPFLGHLSNTTALPAPFILKKNTPTFGIAIERIGRGFHFRVKLWPISPPTSTSTEKKENQSAIMKTICSSFDPIIHAHPEQWLWLHRRWLILDEGFVKDDYAEDTNIHGAS